jgi:hypothetical protein
LSRSSGITFASSSGRLDRALRAHLGAEADGALADALADDLVEPANAPPQMKRMFVVSIERNSWCGCLRPPCGGTDATVPSRIFSSACCTPSPDTSRVIDGLSALRAILSTSSM